MRSKIQSCSLELAVRIFSAAPLGAQERQTSREQKEQISRAAAFNLTLASGANRNAHHADMFLTGKNPKAVGLGKDLLKHCQAELVPNPRSEGAVLGTRIRTVDCMVGQMHVDIVKIGMLHCTHNIPSAV